MRIHTFTHISVECQDFTLYMCIHSDIYIYIDTQIHRYIHTYIHTYIPTYVHTHTRAHTHIHTCDTVCLKIQVAPWASYSYIVTVCTYSHSLAVFLIFFTETHWIFTHHNTYIAEYLLCHINTDCQYLYGKEW